MGNTNALGLPGRTRGMDNISERLRLSIDTGIGGGLVGRRHRSSLQDEALPLEIRKPLDQPRLRQQQFNAGVGEHEGQSRRRIIGIERQIGPTCLEDGEQPDDHLQRTLDTDPHQGLGLHAQRNQMMGQPVGAPVQLGIAQGLLTEH